MPMRVPALAALLVLLGTACAHAPEAPVPSPPPPPARAADLAAWWERQQAREAAERFWDTPRERRRALTRDQFELWEIQRERRLRLPRWPF